MSESARDSAFALACFLPQFVLYTLFVSNDSLAIFLGALTTLQISQFAETGRVNDLMGLAVLTALGLLTKHTFVAFVPVLVGLVWLARGQRPTGPRPLTAVMLFVAIALIPGSYKTVENMRTFGRPIVTTLDFPHDWIVEQQKSYRGWRSFLDANVLALVRSPSLSARTSGAYPLLLYGSFWYSHVHESNFT